MLMAELDPQDALNMALVMRETGDEVRRLILRCQERNRGIVEMRFTDHCKQVSVVIVDEPFEPNVRIYPHWGEDDG